MSSSSSSVSVSAGLPAGRGLFCLAVAGVAWGTAGAAAGLIYQFSDLGAISVSFWRNAAGLVLLTLFQLARRRGLGLRGLRRRELLVRLATGFGLAVFQTAYFGAVQVTGLAIGTVVTLGAGPLLIAAGARLLLHERLPRGGVTAMAAALGGLMVLVLGNPAGAVRPLGVLLALLSAAGYAGASLVARWAGRTGGDDPVTVTAWAFGIGAVLLLPLALATGLLPHSAHPVAVLTVLGYLAAVPTALAYPLYFAGAATVRAATASVIMLIEPVSAAGLGVVLFGEPVTVASFCGGVLLLAAATSLALADLRSGRGRRVVGRAGRAGRAGRVRRGLGMGEVVDECLAHLVDQAAVALHAQQLPGPADAHAEHRVDEGGGVAGLAGGAHVRPQPDDQLGRVHDDDEAHERGPAPGQLDLAPDQPDPAGQVDAADQAERAEDDRTVLQAGARLEADERDEQGVEERGEGGAGHRPVLDRALVPVALGLDRQGHEQQADEGTGHGRRAREEVVVRVHGD
ncbi:MAG: DMT family transporter [Actinobacteria bacterium]|nr:DMT family transporter [Actinomycetota bacterium]